MLTDWNDMAHKPARNQVHFMVTGKVILYTSLSTPKTLFCGEIDKARLADHVVKRA